MDYGHINHGQAFNWQTHQNLMDQNAKQYKFTHPPFQLPSHPSHPVPVNPTFLDKNDQGFNLQHVPPLHPQMPLYDTSAQANLGFVPPPIPNPGPQGGGSVPMQVDSPFTDPALLLQQQMHSLSQQPFQDPSTQSSNKQQPGSVRRVQFDLSTAGSSKVSGRSTNGDVNDTSKNPQQRPVSIPQAIILINEEPVSRTYPPSQEREAPKKIPPVSASKKAYEGAQMTVSDFQEYRQNLIYLGKPDGDFRKAKFKPLPEFLAELGPVPPFKGNPESIQDIKAHQNAITEWANHFLTSSTTVLQRHRTEEENLRKAVDTLDFNRRKFTEAVELIGGDKDMDPGDLLFRMNNEINQLQSDVDMLAHHHESCQAVQRAIDSYDHLSQGDQALVTRYLNMVSHAKLELATTQASLETKEDHLRRAVKELKESKLLLGIYQVQIQEFVNKENFTQIAKLQVIQKLQDTETAKAELDLKYNELFQQLTFYHGETDRLRAILSWMPADSPMESQGIDPEDPEEAERREWLHLKERYMSLLTHAEAIVRENGRMRDQASQENPGGVLALEAELAKKQEELDKLIEEHQKTLKELEESRGDKQSLARQKTHWGRQKKELADSLEREKDGVSVVYDAWEIEKRKWQEKNRELEEGFKLELQGRELKLKSREEEIKKLTDEWTALDKQLDKLKSVLKKRDQEIAKRADERDNLRKRRDELAKQKESALTELAQAKKRSEDMVKSHESLQKEYTRIFEFLNKEYMPLAVYTEALKKRPAQEGYPTMAFKEVVDESGNVKRATEECITKSELQYVVASDEFRKPLLFWLKAIGEIKDSDIVSKGST